MSLYLERTSSKFLNGAAFDEVIGTFVPLLHTSFFPDLMQVYFKPAEVLVEFSLVQVDPALTAAFETSFIWIRRMEATKSAIKRRFIHKE